VKKATSGIEYVGNVHNMRDECGGRRSNASKHRMCGRDTEKVC
jgi:hypothetical protein